MIDRQNRERLTRLAADSIAHGARHGCELSIDAIQWPSELRELRSSFVTLHMHGNLRGCIGSLAAAHPLVRDVSLHAYAAAFRDPRFQAVSTGELDQLDIHISVLSGSAPLDFDNESELLDLLRPGVDGLILKEGTRRATFLPEVWEKLPEPRQFMAQLKLKAGLAADYWSDGLIIERYTTESW